MPADDNLIEQLTEPLRDQVAVSYARQLPREDCAPVECYTRDFNYPAQSRIKSAEDLKTLGIKTFFCSNVCAAYRREIYEELGGFVKHTIFNEDMIYAAKAVEAGYAIAYAADAGWSIPIIIPMDSSSTGILTWGYPRQNIRKSSQHILRSPRENEW